MDFYSNSNRYFIINKILLANLGLWPYDSYRKKLILRIFVSLVLYMIILPQVIRIYLYFGVDLDILIEHLAFLVYLLIVYLKILTSIFSENKLKTVYDNISTNWKMIKDEHERNILMEYSERGRMLTIGYVIYMYGAATTFYLFPLAPIILDAIKPLNETRPHIFVFGGDFFVDREEYYGSIYVFDSFTCIITAVILTAVDSMYASSIEHCLGLFAIIQFRLQNISKLLSIKNVEYNKLLNKDEAYEYIVQIIELHKKVIRFTKVLESSYSSSFFVLMGFNMIILSFELVLLVIKFDRLLDFIRHPLILCGIVIHLFYISLPGQKLITRSAGLFHDTYLNEWYDIPLKAQKLLGFMTLRCAQPCQLTAGGIYIMNFANFALILKTSTSYMTLFASLR